MIISSKTNDENPNYLGLDEDHDGDWNDFYQCPNKKCDDGVRYNYITREMTHCPKWGAKLDWVDDDSISVNENMVDKVYKLLKDHAENVSNTHWVNAIHEDKFTALATAMVGVCNTVPVYGIFKHHTNDVFGYYFNKEAADSVCETECGDDWYVDELSIEE